MQSLDYCYLTAFICSTYLIFLLTKRHYRLLLPSIMHTLTWLITVVILMFQLTGTWVSTQITNSSVSLSSEYILYLVISSIIGFTISHCIVYAKNINKHVRIVDIDIIDKILIKFKWIPFTCFFIGLLLIYYLVSSGNFQTFGSYRGHAVTTSYSGIWSIIKQISGHINIWGNLFLMLLGYKHGIQGIKIKELLIFIFLCSTINMATGGRLWIITSTLPYFVSYLYVNKFALKKDKVKNKDKRKILFFLIIFASTFALIGIMRDDRDVKASFVDKFLYYTDGTRMSNMVLNQYPPDTYALEYGACEFLGQIVESPMNKRFNESISGDVGLSVTVKSAIPSLYYDFGYTGGIIMWGLFCFILELFSLKLLTTKKIIGILLLNQIIQLLFLVPIFDVFSVAIPTFEWIIIIYLLRFKLFGNITGIRKYL